MFRSHLKRIKRSKDPEENRQFQAQRSNMQWVDEELFNLFPQFHDPVVLHRLQCGVTSALDLEQQAGSLSSFFELLVCTAGERSWYMLHFTFTMPEQWAGMLAPLRVGLDAFEEFCNTAKLIIRAEIALQDPHHEDRVVTQL